MVVRIPPWFLVEKKHGPISDFDVLTHTSHMAFGKQIYSSLKGKYNSTQPVNNMFLKTWVHLSLILRHERHINQTTTPPNRKSLSKFLEAWIHPSWFSQHPIPFTYNESSQVGTAFLLRKLPEAPQVEIEA